jgi:hypothetical protein
MSIDVTMPKVRMRIPLMMRTYSNMIVRTIPG